MRAAVIIAAAGSGSRMRSEVPKQFLELGGKPLLIHCVETFAGCAAIAQIIIAVAGNRVESTRSLLLASGISSADFTVVAGGRRRQDSVRNGLDVLADDIDIALVHDGARPLVSESLILSCCDAIKKHGAAVAAVPVNDTLKRQQDDRFVAETVDRAGLWQAQTPQGARRDLFAKAWEINGDEDVTDESSLFEKAGIPVAIIAGESANLKITRPEDLLLAESLMITNAPIFRIGHGFDAHRFAEDRSLVLGGVTIPHDHGLAGHSDADVVCHALCDAILGAVGEGDIGRHFPDNDAAYEGISSLLLLDRTVELASQKGFVAGNADITIVCQAPRLAPHMAAMKEALSAHCRMPADDLNIKATTMEKMGYTGRAEGISCHAVVLLQNIRRP